eukprot:187779-Chlamydomonas_euryale.AAC.2
MPKPQQHLARRQAGKQCYSLDCHYARTGPRLPLTIVAPLTHRCSGCVEYGGKQAPLQLCRPAHHALTAPDGPYTMHAQVLGLCGTARYASAAAAMQAMQFSAACSQRSTPAGTACYPAQHAAMQAMQFSAACSQRSTP